jgi:uncharacterized membrane protein required for colicin V production
VRWGDRALGIILGLLVGIAIVIVFVFVFSEDTIDSSQLDRSGPAPAEQPAEP